MFLIYGVELVYLAIVAVGLVAAGVYLIKQNRKNRQ